VVVKPRKISAKCLFSWAIFIELDDSELTIYGRVDTCTGLLPDYKPRYVMGVVRLYLPFNNTG
jgi:hypothetical protein